MKRAAAAIRPESAAEAPISGSKSNGENAQCASAPATAVNTKKSEEADRTEAARDRRPERDQPDAVDADMRPGAMQEGVGGEGPDAHAVSSARPNP